MKIYLSSYYTRNYDVPKDVYYINIARKNMDGVKDKRISLAPSQELFSWYHTHKDEPDWFDYYKVNYYKQILFDEKAKAEIDKIKELAKTSFGFLEFCLKYLNKDKHKSIEEVNKYFMGSFSELGIDYDPKL